MPAFGIDGQTGEWSAGYANRKTTGFTNPDNKQNHIARWLVALYDVTRKPIYRERAEKWFQVMKLRMKARENGRYYVWNYWEPAGPWDYKADGSPSHWVGVHPNGGYYQIDVEGIVCAFEHGWVFTREMLTGSSPPIAISCGTKTWRTPNFSGSMEDSLIRDGRTRRECFGPPWRRMMKCCAKSFWPITRQEGGVV